MTFKHIEQHRPASRPPGTAPDLAPEELHLIAFDVADRRRRNRLVRHLQRYGQRVQESVFEAWLTPAQRAALLQGAQARLHPEQDRLACYALTADDQRHVRLIGVGAALTPNPDYVLL